MENKKLKVRYFLFILVCILLLSDILLLGQKPDDVRIYKSVDTLNLQLFIFNPPGHKSSDISPCIVFFHGGGWNNGSPKAFFRQAEYLASRGMVAISVQYRLRDSNGTSPVECVRDGKSAIRWVRGHAKELGIDPDMIAAGGGSAGGHVAAAAALLKSYDEENEDISVSSKPNALVLFNPVIDNGPDGYGFEKVKNFWMNFSPMHNIDSSAPPTLFMVGTNDRLIPVSTAEKYKSIMESYGCRCDLILYENEKHGFFNKSKFAETLDAADKFLVSLGYLKPGEKGSKD